MADPDSPVRADPPSARAPGVFADFPEALAPALQAARSRAASGNSTRTRPRPSTHASAGRNVVVVTPTASGKTLCYNLPVLNRLMADPGARAMYLFPTKALAEDQLHEFQARAWTRWAREHPRLHLRRRHAAGRAPGHSRARQRGAHQSRHAALRHPAAPHQVGQGVREPALHRHRRAALLSRRLRQPPGQRAAAAEAHLRVLRLVAAVHLLLGHHRQSQGAGRGAHRTRRSSWWRDNGAPVGREVLRLLQSAGGEPRSSASAAAI